MLIHDNQEEIRGVKSMPPSKTKNKEAMQNVT